MRNSLLHCSLFLLALLAGGTALGEEASRPFDIEVLVFAHVNAYDGGEAWPWEAVPDLPPANWGSQAQDETRESLQDPSEGRTVAASFPEGNADWQALPASARRLTAVAEALRRSSQYRPLAHLNWRQALVEPSAARTVDIAALAGTMDDRAIPRLEGSLRLSVARYLHLETDLRLVEGDPYANRDDRTAIYRLQQSRRMRSGELHYLDHPRLGILALITPSAEGE